MTINSPSFAEKINATFSFLSGKKIILYGTGSLATKILECNELKFEIFGILDGQLTNGYFMGKPIYNMENLPKSETYAIIVAALGVNRPIIYERIKDLKKNGCKIYYPDGTEPSDDTYSIKKYLENLDKQLLPIIEQADVVSFDCFDTLIMRLTLSPLPQNQNSIEYEMNICECRGDILKYKKYAEQLGKIVVLTSDMYFSSNEIKALTLKCELGSFDNYFISSELNATKENGHIWRHLKEAYPGKKIAHIDDMKFDYPDYISGNQIKSTTEVAQLFKLPLNTGKLTGILLSGIFNLNTVKALSFCIIAPFAIGFVQWLAEKFRQNNEKRVLFCSRDGYLAKIIYDYLYKDKNGYPESGYLYTSKSVLVKACATDSEFVMICLNAYYPRFNKKTKIREAIFRLFGYKLPDCDFADKTVKSLSTEEVYKALLKYERDIKEHCTKEKQNFINYIQDAGYNIQTDALVDFTCGFTVFLLQKIFNGNIYLASLNDFSDFAKLNLTKINSFFSNIDIVEMSSLSINKYSHFFESMISSSEKSVVRISEEKKPIFDENEISPNPLIKEEIFNSIIEFHRQSSRLGINNYEPENIKAITAIMLKLFSDKLSEITTEWSSYTANKY